MRKLVSSSSTERTAVKSVISSGRSIINKKHQNGLGVGNVKSSSLTLDYKGSRLMLEACTNLYERNFHHQINPNRKELQSVSYQEKTLKEGDVIDGWVLEAIQELKDFDLVAYRLKHTQTGAEYLHLDAPFDMNNCFAITFETPPNDDTGIPHILEHTTLCGSEKYPVRDLFFNMMKRSLNTYMNAYTASDHTTYPFSTQNEKDFYNLMSVYLDSTLSPRILNTDFKQEGHRLEFENPLDANSPLKIKGVVYNEMKGAMSDSNQFFGTQLHKAVLPGTIYAFNSGGEPQAIPNLTYEELKNFHKQNYHPSRAKIFTYGCFSFLKHIKFMNENAFSKFSALPSRKVPKQVQRFTEPKRVEVFGPPDSMVIDEQKQTKVAIAYVMNDKSDTFETFSLSFLSALLMDDPRGVFYKNIIASGLAPDFAPYCGFDSSVGDPIFTIGAQGIANDQVEAVEKAIEDTFHEVIENGIDQGLIDTVLHSLELSIKKKSPNFGVNICFPVFSNWIHNDDPISTFKINYFLDKLRKELENPNFFKDKIKKYFLNNTHKVTFVMNPDPNYFDKQEAMEAAKLDTISMALSESDKAQIVAGYKEMEETKVEQAKNVEVLPTLTVDDLSRKLIDVQTVQLVKDKAEPEFHMNVVKGTNGIIHVTTIVPFSLAEVPDHLQKFVPIFGDLLVRVGTSKLNYLQLAHQIELHTGGIDASPILVPSLEKIDEFSFALKFSSYCLERNAEKMVYLMREIYTDVNFLGDLNFLQNCVDQAASDAASGILHSGHHYAKLHAASNITFYDSLINATSGIDAMKFLKHLSTNANTELIANSLQELVPYLLRKKKMKILITCEEHQRDRMMRVMERQFYEAIENETLTSEAKMKTQLEFKPKFINSYLSIPSSVSFVGRALMTTPFVTKDSALLRVVSAILHSNYLHQEVRERGGAYGSNASQSMNGVFTFSSYRDPNPSRTIGICSNVAEWIQMKDSVTPKTIQEAKLQVFQHLDAPVTPHAHAQSKVVFGIDDELRQFRRNVILDATRSEIVDTCVKYLSRSPNVATTIIGGNFEKDIADETQRNQWAVEKEEMDNSRQ
ncbi:hypothetical protein C9374_013825 [Naegleria lovaniensis]|uniref:Presequence protease, mitochondrial n=1 Tax=Naegleria lovaniensis TaxID=51637 RepID=A0AA88G519_NAELO|nr:uncharacterized protein C9374_013825 [Naegleria lovaniensis]KAG2370821.1 hypothetical protein C9374_013825 [Naegleria lovaniensis]